MGVANQLCAHEEYAWYTFVGSKVWFTFCGLVGVWFVISCEIHSAMCMCVGDLHVATCCVWFQERVGMDDNDSDPSDDSDYAMEMADSGDEEDGDSDEDGLGRPRVMRCRQSWRKAFSFILFSARGYFHV